MQSTTDHTFDRILLIKLLAPTIQEIVRQWPVSVSASLPSLQIHQPLVVASVGSSSSQEVVWKTPDLSRISISGCRVVAGITAAQPVLHLTKQSKGAQGRQSLVTGGNHGFLNVRGSAFRIHYHRTLQLKRGL